MSQQNNQNFASQVSTFRQKTHEYRTQIKTFKNILEEVGINLSLNDDPHILRREQALVLKDLEKALQTSDKACNEFVTGLQVMCKKEKYFRKALLFTNLKKDNELSYSVIRNGKIEQESLIRIFLKVTELQQYIFEILFEEIAHNAAEATEDTTWLHLLLNPLHYLPYVKDPEILTTKVLDILEVATLPAQLEILSSIPEIIPDEQRNETAKELCRLLEDKDELTGAIIDCLNALGLEPEMRSEVQDGILNKIISGRTSLKMFPILITFLLTDCKSQNLVQTLLKIRNAIDALMLNSHKKGEKDSCKILIFQKLQILTVSSKNISEAWLNMIAVIKSSSDHKPVDYLIMFMLHHIIPFKKKIIEGIFRKRIQMGLFKINQMEKMFEKYLIHQLIKDYFHSIIEIGCTLIRSSEDLRNKEFSMAIFKLLFSHPYTENIYRQDIIDNLIGMVGANDKKTVNTVIKILSSFLEQKEKFKQFTISLMRLLEKFDSLELKHVKQVFDLLCSLTCGEHADESTSGMRNELHMIVRKQLYSTKKTGKLRGVVTGIVMAHHMVRISNTEEESSVTKPITNVSELPPGAIKEAGTLLDLTYTCTSNCPELTGLYYDELTSMLMLNSHIDKYFMSWLYETVHENFEKNYAINDIPEKNNYIEFSRQYMLNRISETNVNVAINIGGLTLNNDSKILLLASHFRLLRIIHYRQNDGQLDGINALLGCSVIMPNIDIEDIGFDQAKQMADCLFHCVNWFREIISAFVAHKNKNIRIKTVRRLKDLLEVEKKLNDCLTHIPNHKLPMSYFTTCEFNKQFVSPVKVDKSKNRKKRLKSTEINQTADVTASSQKAKKITASKTNITYSLIFREIDTDLFVLLKYPLTLSESEMSPSTTLNIDQLKFVLVNLTTKLDALSHERDLGLQHLTIVEPLQMIKDCVILIQHLDSHLKVLVNEIKQLLETVNGKLDISDLFTPEALNVKMCFSLILRTYQLIFSWTGFQHSTNLEVLKNLLKSVRSESSQSLNSAQRLVVEFITKISNLHEYCLELPQGVSLVQTIETLNSLINPKPEDHKKISSVAEKLLSKRWYNTKGLLDTGKNANLNIGILVKAYLSSANVKIISGLIGTLQNEIEKLVTKEDNLQMLPSIDKQNFHVLYNALCTALLYQVKTEVQSLTNNEHLILWKTTSLTMQGLMGIAKTQETKTNLTTFLKKCIGILKVFLSDGIPVLELILRSKPDDVVDIFKNMQTSTRFLHHLCCYSKLTKDSSLVALVPKFRLTLETLVYRVKAALAANNCCSAFWMGNLKNRDLQGEDILSQCTTITEVSEENSEEELPDDDSDTNSISHDDTNSANYGTSSEVFD